MLILSPIFIVLGWGLWHLTKWAWNGAVILTAFGLVTSVFVFDPVAITIDFPILIYLFHVKYVFDVEKGDGSISGDRRDFSKRVECEE